MTGYQSIEVAEVGGRGRYELLTSLVVPRPIGWISTWSADRVPNLAPFSYFGGVSASPMLVSVSIGRRRYAAKDTARNIRDRGAFCVNVVTERHLEAMVATSAEVDPEVDEFALAGLEAGRAAHVDAPFVEGCPAVLECTLFREVDLGEVPAALIVGEVVSVRIGEAVPFEPGSLRVDPERLRPVGRLGGDVYAPLGSIERLPRPKAG